MPRGPGPLGNQVERLIQGLLDPGKGLVNPRRYKKPGRKSGYKNPIMQEARRLYDAAGRKASGRPWTSFVKLAATRVPKTAKRLKARKYPRTQMQFYQPRFGFIGEQPPPVPPREEEEYAGPVREQQIRDLIALEAAMETENRGKRPRPGGRPGGNKHRRSESNPAFVPNMYRPQHVAPAPSGEAFVFNANGV